MKTQPPSNLHISDPELKEWLDALKNIIDEDLKKDFVNACDIFKLNLSS